MREFNEYSSDAGQMPHVASLPAAISQFCSTWEFVHGKTFTDENLKFSSQQRIDKYVQSFLMSIWKSLVRLRKKMNTSIFCSLFSSSVMIPYLSAVCFVQYGLVAVLVIWTAQVKVIHGLYAMIRWLLRSLMSAGGTKSFFTGVGSSVVRLPLGLNRSDTKNTCGSQKQTHLKVLYCKVVH